MDWEAKWNKLLRENLAKWEVSHSMSIEDVAKEYFELLDDLRRDAEKNLADGNRDDLVIALEDLRREIFTGWY